MRYVKISNIGEIELNAFRLIGASTKRDSASKIGFFGSGLKYSLAYFLRNEIQFHVFSGEKPILFSTKRENYRDQNFDIVTINGEETSMTTDMGPKWQLWFTLREIYCNALDEGAFEVSIVEDIDSKVGWTSIFIELTPELDQIMKNWDAYFSDKRTDIIWEGVDATMEPAKILEPYFEHVNEDKHQKLIIYRKGVACHNERKKCLFNYDMPWININESRIIESTYSFRHQLVQWLKTQATDKVIARLLSSRGTLLYGTYEGELSWDSYSFGMNWLPHVRGKFLIPTEVSGWFEEEMKVKDYLILPNDMIQGLKADFGDELDLAYCGDGSKRYRIKKNLTQKEEFLLKEAKSWLEECKWEVEFDIEVAIFEEPSTLGYAQSNPKKIILAEKVFDHGKKKIVETVIEENEHLISGCGDKTRGFQDHLITKMVSILEEKNAYFL